MLDGISHQLPKDLYILLHSRVNISIQMKADSNHCATNVVLMFIYGTLSGEGTIFLLI